MPDEALLPGARMIPIHALLQRIRWDPEFGKGEFVIGCYDRVARRVLRIPMGQLELFPGQHFSFDVIGEDGVRRMMPFHRVREVWRDGKLIWSRKSGAD